MTILKPVNKLALLKNAWYKVLINQYGIEAVKQSLRRNNNGNNRKETGRF